MAVWLRWQPPRLRADDEAREAKITSVDLFYDLVFAVVVAQLATGLSADLTPSGFLVFALLFVAAVRVWSSETFYSDHFESIDVSYRASVFFAVLPAGGMAVAAPQGMGALFPLFALSMAVARLVIVGQWWRAGRHERSARPLARRYLLLYGTIAALWTAAAAGPMAWRLPVAGAAVLLDLASPLFVTRLQAQLGRLSGEHLSDRFGSFFLLVLGQIVVVTVLVMTRMRQPSFADLTAGVLIFALSFSLWWVYVDHVLGRPLRLGNEWNAVWTYLNIPMFMATAAFGAAAVTFVTKGEQVVPEAVRWLLAGSYASVMLFSGLAEIALEPLDTSVPILRVRRRLSRIALLHGLPAVLATGVGAVSTGWAAAPLLIGLLVVGLFAILIGEYARAGQ